MKRLVVSMVILLAGFLILTRTFAAPEGEEPKPAKESKTPESGKVPMKEDKAYAFLGGHLDFLADPNAIRTKVNEFEGLEKALEELSERSREEMRGWTSGIGPKIRIDEDTLDDRIDLVRDVQYQVLNELVLLREFAIEEKAKKTTAAIEGLLLARRERYESVYDKMQKAEKQIRRRDRDSRTQRTRESDRERNRDREERFPKRR